MFPDQAVLGGLLIGIGSGAYMCAMGRVAGCSGALRSAVASPGGILSADRANICFLVGLLLAGRVFGLMVPSYFEKAGSGIFSLEISDAPRLVVAGVLTGLGTSWGNGCTSGHGLSGLSRFSFQSLVAVPVFMAAAGLTASSVQGFASGSMVPIADFGSGFSEDVTVPTIIAIIAIICASLPVILRTSIMREDCLRIPYIDGYTSGWCGFVFGAGLSVGGMARPSAVTGGLSTARFDATLWILFCTALATTFVFYRMAGRIDKLRDTKGSSCGELEDGEGVVNARLVIGALLFGIGWGLSGYCPGPIMVGLGFNPLGGEAAVVAFACTAGMRLAEPLGTALGIYPPLTLAEEYEKLCNGYDAQTGARQITAQELRQKYTAGERLIVLDTRSPKEHRISCLPGARLCETVNGAMSITYKSELPDPDKGELPEDATIVCNCTAGLRSGWAAVDLEKRWGRPVHSLHGGIVAWSNIGGELHVPSDSQVGSSAAAPKAQETAGKIKKRRNNETGSSRGKASTTNLVHTYSGVWGRFLDAGQGRKAFY